MSKERLLFKFYKSYFETAKLLNDKDRLAFYDALLDKQFYGREPKLKGLANLVYISQKHSIDLQVKGWEDYFKTQLPDNKNNNHPIIGGIIDPMIQEEEEYKVKEKDKRANKFAPPTLINVIDYFIENGYTENSATKAFNYYDCAEWIDSKGNKVKSWKQKMQSVWFKDENKIINTPQVIKPKMVEYLYGGRSFTMKEQVYLEEKQAYGDKVTFVKYI